MRGLLIDPVKRAITVVEIADWRGIAPALGCDMFDCINLRLDHETLTPSETLYVDDEGRFGYPNPLGYFEVGGVLLCGRGVVLGCDPEGESRDTAYSIDELKRLVIWRDTPPQEEVEPDLHFVEFE